jgi:hypothetical protein
VGELKQITTKTPRHPEPQKAFVFLDVLVPWWFGFSLKGFS